MQEVDGSSERLERDSWRGLLGARVCGRRSWGVWEGGELRTERLADRGRVSVRLWCVWERLSGMGRRKAAEEE